MKTLTSRRIEPPSNATAFWVERPGVAPRIAANGWTCVAHGCRRKPTVEVGWMKPHGNPMVPGASVIKQGACEEHAAEFQARLVNADA